MSGGLVGFLAARDISIAATSYQSGKLYLIGRNPHGGLMINENFFRKAMGLHVAGKGLYLATLFQIMRLESGVEPGHLVNRTFDACFVPRTTHVTGVLDAHDVGVMDDGEIVFVNTRYNCLAAVSEKHSFRPIWKPSFISRIVDEDRCHLNGMAMDGGRPRYVTAVSKSDTIDGWRDRRASGGIVMDVERNEIICEGLSMPHSPRVHGGRLWLLNSGTGELGWVDGVGENGGGAGRGGSAGKFIPLAFCPGFVRGLAFSGKFAFVGLSKPRYERFEGLALDEKLRATDSEPWCGIQVIDLDTGACVQWFRIDGAIGELYDVAVLPGIACPMSLGFMTDEILGLITHEAFPGETNPS
ncbi:MAG: TIGR03032 family protein [Rhizobiales bacterium]|nr:TIGR03032 family protein [Hyphomicrobiales bacterium]